MAFEKFKENLESITQSEQETQTETAKFLQKAVEIKGITPLAPPHTPKP